MFNCYLATSTSRSRKLANSLPTQLLLLLHHLQLAVRQRRRINQGLRGRPRFLGEHSAFPPPVFMLVLIEVNGRGWWCGGRFFYWYCFSDFFFFSYYCCCWLRVSGAYRRSKFPLHQPPPREALMFLFLQTIASFLLVNIDLGAPTAGAAASASTSELRVEMQKRKRKLPTFAREM